MSRNIMTEAYHPVGGAKQLCFCGDVVEPPASSLLGDKLLKVFGSMLIYFHSKS